MNSFGAGICELKSYAGEFIELEDNPVTKNAQYLAEMDAFTDFLIKLNKTF